MRRGVALLPALVEVQGLPEVATPPTMECGLSCPGTSALRDLESPGALRVAARAHASADAQLILLASGPGSKSMTMLSNLEGMLSRCAIMLSLAIL